MSVIQKLNGLKSKPNSVIVPEHLTGLSWMRKVFTESGDKAAFLSESKLDLDTDGTNDPGITYESTHQSQTSIDTGGVWLSSNKLNYLVLPGGFATPSHGPARRGGIVLGCLATVVYGENIAHAIFADTGPTSLFGEGSLSLHRNLGFERVKADGQIQNVGISYHVWTLIYLHSRIAHLPCTQDEIDAQAEPLWKSFLP